MGLPLTPAIKRDIVCPPAAQLCSRPAGRPQRQCCAHLTSCWRLFLWHTSCCLLCQMQLSCFWLMPTQPQRQRVRPCQIATARTVKYAAVIGMYRISPSDMCIVPVAGRNGAGHQQSAAPSSRELFLHQNPELLQKFGSDLLPLLLQVYNNTALPQVQCAGLCALKHSLCANCAACAQADAMPSACRSASSVLQPLPRSCTTHQLLSWIIY